MQTQKIISEVFESAILIQRWTTVHMNVILYQNIQIKAPPHPLHFNAETLLKKMEK